MEMMAVVAAVVVMVIPRAAARSREAALRTQLRELQGAVDRCMAERGEVPELSGAVMGVQEGDPVWYQEGKRRLQVGDWPMPIDWTKLMGEYIRAWPDRRMLGTRNPTDASAVRYGGTGDALYGLVRIGEWAARGDYAASVDDAGRIQWALWRYRQDNGCYPDVIDSYQTLRRLILPYLRLPEHEEELPWRFYDYKCVEPDSYTLRLVHYPSPDRYIVMSFGPGGCGLVAKAPAARREEVKA